MTGIAIPVLPQTDETSKWTPKLVSALGLL